MMEEIYFNPDYKNFNFEKPKDFEDLPKNLRQRRHVMIIKEYKENRSKAQNAYMWGVVYEILSKETGYETEEVHQEMGKLFLAYEKKGKWFVRSTTDLDTKEMEEYLARIRKWASMKDGLFCFIPLPNETEFSYEIK